MRKSFVVNGWQVSHYVTLPNTPMIILINRLWLILVIRHAIRGITVDTATRSSLLCWLLMAAKQSVWTQEKEIAVANGGLRLLTDTLSIMHIALAFTFFI